MTPTARPVPRSIPALVLANARPEGSGSKRRWRCSIRPATTVVVPVSNAVLARLQTRDMFEAIYEAVARESGMYGDDVRQLVSLTLTHAVLLIDGEAGG